MTVNRERIKLIKPALHNPRDEVTGKGPVLYWMSRNQRAADNWSMLYARELALRYKLPFLVCFCMVSGFAEARKRHYRFMLEGLQEVAGVLDRFNIPFIPLFGSPKEKISGLAKEAGASALIVDFDPLRVKREWYAGVCEKVNIPVYEVDGRNVIPAWHTSEKQEYAARTIRPKIHRLLPEFLEEFPSLERHPYNEEGGTYASAAPWERLFNEADKLSEGPDVSWIEPGESAARRRLKEFIENVLPFYHLRRNDPTKNSVSGLSPYLHFGQLAAARAALNVRKAAPDIEDAAVEGGAAERFYEAAKAFLEELIVRRELSDNYCRYNSGYDSVKGFPDWARKTLNKHRNDRREYIYSREELEEGRTHDPLWNAAQIRMVRYGTMHGYLRMYWAKKILEWNPSPEEAVDHAVFLNDAYQLDGRDPNGYTGVAWAIGGVHDRPWGEREIFGTVRYMSYAGCKRKFDVKQYIEEADRPPDFTGR